MNFFNVLGIDGNFRSVFIRQNPTPQVFLSYFDLNTALSGIKSFSLDFNSSQDVDVASNFTESNASFNVLNIDGNDNNLYVIASDQDADYGNSIYSFANDAFSLFYSVNDNSSYIRKIRVFDSSFAIAVGTDFSIMTDGSNFINVNNAINNSGFNGFIGFDARVIDTNRAIIVGSFQNIAMAIYSLDSFVTWNSLLIGNHENATVENNDPTGVIGFVSGLFMPDNDSFVFVFQEGTGLGHGKIISMFLPNLLNKKSNDLVEFVGNTRLKGDLIMDDLGEIKVSSQTLNIAIGKDVEMTTLISQNAFVEDANFASLLVTKSGVFDASVSFLDNFFMDGSLNTFTGDVVSNNNFRVDGLSSLNAIDTSGNIDVGGQLNVSGDTHLFDVNVQRDLLVGRTFTVTGIDIENGLLLQW